MHSGTRSRIGIALTVVACLGPGLQTAGAQQLRIEGAFPRQLPPGHTTTIHLIIGSREAIQSAEVSPPQGITVSRIQQGESTQGALTWSHLTFEVARDAKPGARTLVLVLPAGRTAPLPITVPTHVPSLADLRLLAASSKQATVELQVAASDASGDLGELPHVWFSLGCGREPLVGVVRGKAAAQPSGGTLVRASLPTAGQQAAATCELQMRITDSAGIESNTLRTSVAFTN